ncbi:DDE_3 domain-containing protein [Trichonephila clavipes]|nr:DDE_3 domain-containing protein [Trichonephila clavipes]
MLGRRIVARQPLHTYLPELRRALLDEWCNIPQDQIDNLILSMPRRCNASFTSSGRQTPWRHHVSPPQQFRDGTGGEGNILQTSAPVFSAVTAPKTFEPTDLTSTYSVYTRRVFGSIEHRTQAIQSCVRLSSH